MKFGLFYEIQAPEEPSRRQVADVLHQVVDQAVLAEQVGFHSFWTVEHHCLGAFSISSAPEVLYGYVAARTSTIRIGHGVRLLPSPYNHPIRVAEMAATLDCLSEGRLELGTGRSATMTELDAFGIDPSETRSMWRESLEMVVEMFKDGEFEHDGTHWKVPRRLVLPKPLQEPHPPLWVSATSEDTHALAGQLGLGLLSFTLALNIEEVGRRIGIYRDAMKDATPIGAVANEQAAVFTLTHCGRTNAEARATAEHGVMNYNRQQISVLSQMGPVLGSKGGYEYYKTFVGVDYDKFTYDYLLDRDMVMVGDAARCKEILRRYQDIGVDHILCHMQMQGIPHEETMASIRRFGEDIIPEFS
jgi:alkanesulfonate monooxygenase SsuD/methylene tetrahydromethanopterin reductase-like flavin-dependent oxidoreductase (luciferase family)